MRTFRHLLSGAALLLWSPHLAAQAIRGTVIDVATDQPVPAVTIELLDTTSAAVVSVVADQGGAFVLSAPSPGVYRIRARHPGYPASQSAALAVEEPDTLTVQYRLAPRVVLLNPITVTAPSRPSPGRPGRLDERARRSMAGHFLTREAIERRHPLRASDLFFEIPGVELVPTRGGLGNAVLLRGCAPAVFLNGVRVHDGARALDDLVSPIDLEAIEVYRGPSEVPAELAGPGTDCGAIVLWTK